MEERRKNSRKRVVPLARKMYLYRADYDSNGEHRVRFFYARNARVGKTFAYETFSEEGLRPQHIRLTKFGIMKEDIGNPDCGEMDQEEETKLILTDFGAGKIFAERDGDVRG